MANEIQTSNPLLEFKADYNKFPIGLLVYDISGKPLFGIKRKKNYDLFHSALWNGLHEELDPKQIRKIKVDSYSPKYSEAKITVDYIDSTGEEQQDNFTLESVTIY